MDLVLLIAIATIFLLTLAMRYDPASRLIEFIEKQEGVFISKSSGPISLNMIGSFTAGENEHAEHFYKVIYYDHHDNLREAIVRHDNSKEYSFYDNRIIRSSGEVLKEESEKEHAFKKVDYRTKKGVFTILQEYDRPNVREKITLNGEPLPGGKYRLGFMTFAIVKRGRIIRMTSS